jgi:hypothetical protein
MKDIENARRRREIELIDKNLQMKNQRSSHGMELKNDEFLDINEQHQTGVNKLDFRKSHNYIRRNSLTKITCPDRKGKKGPENKIFSLTLMTNKIEENSIEDMEEEDA